MSDETMDLWSYTPPAGERETSQRSAAPTPATTPQADDYAGLRDALDNGAFGEVDKTYVYSGLDPDEIEDETPSDEPEAIEVAPGQANLFGDNDQFTVAGQEWQGMPEYVSGNLTPWRSMLVHFASYEDMRAFAQLIGQPNITVKTKSVWYPEVDVFHFIDKRYVTEGEKAS